MKQFKVYKNPQGDYEAVKQGWSWVAFFFTFIWAMIARMWGLGVGFLIGMMVLSMIVGTIDASQVALPPFFPLVINIVFGIKGNKWRENSLIKRGYEFKDAVTAANKVGAIALAQANSRSSGQSNNS